MSIAGQPELLNSQLWSALALLLAVLVAARRLPPVDWSFATAPALPTAPLLRRRAWSALVSMVAAPEPEALGDDLLDGFDIPLDDTLPPAEAAAPVAPAPEPAPEAAAAPAPEAPSEPLPFPEAEPAPAVAASPLSEPSMAAPATATNDAPPAPVAAADDASPAPAAADDVPAAPAAATDEVPAAPAAAAPEDAAADAPSAETTAAPADAPGLVSRLSAMVSGVSIPPLRADAATLVPAGIGAVVMFAVMQFGGALMPGGGGDEPPGDTALAHEIERLAEQIEALGGALITFTGGALPTDGIVTDGPDGPAADEHTIEADTHGASPAAGAETPEATDGHATDSRDTDGHGTESESATGHEAPAGGAADGETPAHATPTPDPTVGTEVTGILPTGEEAGANGEASAPGDPSSPYYTNGQNTLNCSNFETWEAAQAALEANQPGDPNLLDLDGNGTACESLLRE